VGWRNLIHQHIRRMLLGVLAITLVHLDPAGVETAAPP
jgi:hypothetical protein